MKTENKLPCAIVLSLLIPLCIFAQNRGQIKGRVVDQETGDPLIGVNVTIEGTASGAATSSVGWFEINHVPPGRYTIEVSFMGYKKAQQEIFVTAGEVRHVEFKLVETTVEMEEIIVRAVRETLARRHESPISKITVDEGTIRRYDDPTVGDMLRRMPGVYFGGPPAENKDVRLRGMDKEYTQVLINGRRIPGGGEKREFQIDRIPADMVERIEIVHNPTAEMDAQGIAGTINIVMKQAPQARTATWTAGGGLLTHQGAMSNATLTYGETIGGIGYLLNGNVQRRLVGKDKDKETFKNDTIDKLETEDELKKLTETNFAPNFTWAFHSSSIEVNPFVLYSREDKDKNKGRFKKDGSLDRRETEDEIKTRSTIGIDAIVTRNLGRQHSIAAEFGVRYSAEDKDKRKESFKGDGKLDKTTLEDEGKSDMEVRAMIHWQGSFSAQHLLKGGIELLAKNREKDKTKKENDKDKTSLKDRYSLDERRFSAYLLDEFHLGRRLTLTPGLRLEYSNTEIDNLRGIGGKGNEVTFNPSFHSRLALSQHTLLRGSIARTVRRPKFEDLLSIVDEKNGTELDPDVAGNPALDTEKAVGLELGIEHYQLQQNSVVALNFFYRDIQDLIEPRLEFNSERQRFERKTINTGDGYVIGAEFDGRFSMKMISLPHLSLLGNFTWLDSKVTDKTTGKKRRFKEQPDYLLNLGFNYDLRRSGVEFGVNYNRISEIAWHEVNNDGKLECSREHAKNFFDFFVSAKIIRSVKLRFAANNLLEAKKKKSKTKYKSNGLQDSIDLEKEGSNRSFMLTLEGSW